MFKTVVLFKNDAAEVFCTEKEPTYTPTTPLFLEFKIKDKNKVTRVNAAEITAFTVIHLDETE